MSLQDWGWLVPIWFMHVTPVELSIGKRTCLLCSKLWKCCKVGKLLRLKVINMKLRLHWQPWTTSVDLLALSGIRHDCDFRFTGQHIIVCIFYICHPPLKFSFLLLEKESCVFQSSLSHNFSAWVLSHSKCLGWRVPNFTAEELANIFPMTCTTFLILFLFVCSISSHGTFSNPLLLQGSVLQSCWKNHLQLPNIGFFGLVPTLICLGAKWTPMREQVHSLWHCLCAV